jgi:hypothetical protein
VELPAKPLRTYATPAAGSSASRRLRSPSLPEESQAGHAGASVDATAGCKGKQQKGLPNADLRDANGELAPIKD